MNHATLPPRNALHFRRSLMDSLLSDHRRIKGRFRQFQKNRDALDLPLQCALVQSICSELMVHLQLEKEFFYPAAWECIADRTQVSQSMVTHVCFRHLLAQLMVEPPGTVHYLAMVCVLARQVEHHMKEEETYLFPKLTSKRIHWEALHHTMQSRRIALADAMMPQHQPMEGADTVVPLQMA